MHDTVYELKPSLVLSPISEPNWCPTEAVICWNQFSVELLSQAAVVTLSSDAWWCAAVTRPRRAGLNVVYLPTGRHAARAINNETLWTQASLRHNNDVRNLSVNETVNLTCVYQYMISFESFENLVETFYLKHFKACF